MGGLPVDSEFAARRKTITAILVEGGAVTSEQVDVALARQRETGRRIGESLVELGFVSEEDIGWALARQLGIPFVDVRPDTLDLELVRSFPDGALRRLQALPLFRSEGCVTAAVADPTDLDSMQEFERLCDARASCVAATPTAIEKALDGILGRNPGFRARTPDSAARPRAEVTWDRSGESFLGFHLSQARRFGIDELHFVCADGWLQVRHRAATRLWTVAREPAAVTETLVARFESLGMKPLAGGEEHREFTARCTIAGLHADVRISVLVARDGLSATIRLLRDAHARPRLESLGLEPLDVAQLRESLLEPSGLVLVSGPKGSGCGTTLAALLAEIVTDERRWTVFTRDAGRPVVPVGVDVVSGPSLGRWRRIALAHSLDGVVLDGGLDGRRVRAVIDPAAHGRWVLARTNWEDTFSLLDWLFRAPGGRPAIAHRLRAVVQQRLVATPLANAARPREDEAGDPHALGGPPEPLHLPVFEVLHTSEAFRQAVLAGARAAELRAIADAEGFRPLSESLRTGVQRGRLDPRDAARAA